MLLATYEPAQMQVKLWLVETFSYLSLPLFVFSFFFCIFIHCHPLLSYGPNFKSLTHWEVSLKSITKFRPDRHTRKRVNKNMVKINRKDEIIYWLLRSLFVFFVQISSWSFSSELYTILKIIFFLGSWNFDKDYSPSRF